MLIMKTGVQELYLLRYVLDGLRWGCEMEISESYQGWCWQRVHAPALPSAYLGPMNTDFQTLSDKGTKKHDFETRGVYVLQIQL